jgi:hypothetical protein
MEINLVQKAGCLSNIAGIPSSDSRVVLVVVEVVTSEKQKSRSSLLPPSISTPHFQLSDAAEHFR